MTLIERFMSIRKKVKRKSWIGWLLILFAVVNAIDFRSPFPIPLVGMPAIAATLILLAIGIKLLLDVYKPQVDATLELIAPETGGILTVVIIKALLGVPLRTAEKTLQTLWDRGYLIHLKDPKNPDEKKWGFCVFKVPFLEKGKRKEAAPQPTEQRTEMGEYSVQEINDLILGGSLPTTDESVPLRERLKNFFRR